MSEILIFSEIHQGTLHSTSGELIAIARKLADELSVKVSAVLLNGTNEHADTVISQGADKAYLTQIDESKKWTADVYISALEQVCIKTNPILVLAAKTPLGRDVGPRLAYRLGTSAAQDCLNLFGDKDSGKISVLRPVYGGSALATFEFSKNTTPLAIMRVKTIEPLPEDKKRSGEVEIIELTLDESRIKTALVETVVQEAEGIKLEDASVIIGGGRGLGGPEPFDQLEELAKLFNGAVGASRAVCDAGWLDHAFQIGLTGKTVTPDLYIMVGISGASQHMAGCSASKTIVAINKDGDANIFKEARYGVVGDWEKVLPSFTSTVADLMKS
jgi:electron transfer flavoprotein alpha subunit|tara:strand:+ start:1 stop:990 length:990 start_codon:yes stop_codon:yes gene_type:complete